MYALQINNFSTTTIYEGPYYPLLNPSMLVLTPVRLLSRQCVTYLEQERPHAKRLMLERKLQRIQLLCCRQCVSFCIMILKFEIIQTIVKLFTKSNVYIQKITQHLDNQLKKNFWLFYYFAKILNKFPASYKQGLSAFLSFLISMVWISWSFEWLAKIFRETTLGSLKLWWTFYSIMVCCSLKKD